MPTPTPTPIPNERLPWRCSHNLTLIRYCIGPADGRTAHTSTLIPIRSTCPEFGCTINIEDGLEPSGLSVLATRNSYFH